MRRRQFLAVLGAVGAAGCSDGSSKETETPASSFPLATDVWHVTPPYPFRFEGELVVPAERVRGWFLASEVQKRIHVDGTVSEGGPVTVLVTDEPIETAQTPTATVKTERDVSSFDESVEIDDSGSILFEADRDTTLDLSLFVERI